jgi:hypothetical protein
VSVALLYKGTKPSIDAMTMSSVMLGAKGSKGLGGAPGVNDGIDGASQLELLSP